MADIVTLDPILTPAPLRTQSQPDFNTNMEGALGALPSFVTKFNQNVPELNKIPGYADTAYNAMTGAVNAPGSGATSTTNTTVAAAGVTRSITVQTGKLFQKGQGVICALTSDPANSQMVGIITNYNSGTGQLDFLVTQAVGIGNAGSAWTIGLAGYTIQAAAGGVASVSSAVDVVLTATSVKAQRVTPTAHGVSVKLPSGLVLAAGLTEYTLSNEDATGKYGLGVRDNSGKLIGVVPPNSVVSVCLVDATTAAGVWQIVGRQVWGALIHAETEASIGVQLPWSHEFDGNGSAGQGVNLASVALSATKHVQFFYNPALSAVYGVVVDFSTSPATIGTPTLVRSIGMVANSTPYFDAYANDATNIVYMWAPVNTVMNVGSISVTGTTITVNALPSQPWDGVTLTAPARNAKTGCRLLRLSATLGVVFYTPTTNNIGYVAFTINGAGAITMGSTSNTFGSVAGGWDVAQRSATSFYTINAPGTASVPSMSIVNIAAGTALSFVTGPSFSGTFSASSSPKLISLAANTWIAVCGNSNTGWLVAGWADTLANTGTPCTVGTNWTTISNLTNFTALTAAMTTTNTTPRYYFADAYSATRAVLVFGIINSSYAVSLAVTAAGVITGDKYVCTGLMFSNDVMQSSAPQVLADVTIKIGAGTYMGRRARTANRQPSANANDNIGVLKYDGTDFSLDASLRVATQTLSYQYCAAVAGNGALVVAGLGGDIAVTGSGRKQFDPVQGHKVADYKQKPQVGATGAFVSLCGASYKAASNNGANDVGVVVQAVELAA